MASRRTAFPRDEHLDADQRKERAFRQKLEGIPHTFMVEYEEDSAARLPEKNSCQRQVKTLEADLKVGQPSPRETSRCLNLHGYLLAVQGKLSEALEQVDEALQGEGEEQNLVSMANRAVILWKDNQFKEANKQLAQIIALKNEAEESVADGEGASANLDREKFQRLIVQAKAEIAFTYTRFGGHFFTPKAIKLYEEVVSEAREPELWVYKFGLALSMRRYVHMISSNPLQSDREDKDLIKITETLIDVITNCNIDGLKAKCYAELSQVLFSRQDAESRDTFEQMIRVVVDGEEFIQHEQTVNKSQGPAYVSQERGQTFAATPPQSGRFQDRYSPATAGHQHWKYNNNSIQNEKDKRYRQTLDLVCSKALDLDPKDSSVLWKVAKVYRCTDRLEEAVELLKKSVLYRPTCTEQHQLGLALKALANKALRERNRERGMGYGGENSGRGGYNEHGGYGDRGRGGYSGRGGYKNRGRGGYSQRGSYGDRGRGGYSERGGYGDRGRGGYSERGGYGDRGRGGYSERGGYGDRGRGGYSERGGYGDRGRGGYSERGGYGDRGRGGYSERGGYGYSSRGGYWGIGSYDYRGTGGYWGRGSYGDRGIGGYSQRGGYEDRGRGGYSERGNYGDRGRGWDDQGWNRKGGNLGRDNRTGGNKRDSYWYDHSGFSASNAETHREEYYGHGATAAVQAKSQLNPAASEFVPTNNNSYSSLPNRQTLRSLSTEDSFPSRFQSSRPVPRENINSREPHKQGSTTAHQDPFSTEDEGKKKDAGGDSDEGAVGFSDTMAVQQENLLSQDSGFYTGAYELSQVSSEFSDLSISEEGSQLDYHAHERSQSSELSQQLEEIVVGESSPGLLETVQDSINQDSINAFPSSSNETLLSGASFRDLATHGSFSRSSMQAVSTNSADVQSTVFQQGPLVSARIVERTSSQHSTCTSVIESPLCQGEQGIPLLSSTEHQGLMFPPSQQHVSDAISGILPIPVNHGDGGASLAAAPCAENQSQPRTPTSSGFSVVKLHGRPAPLLVLRSSDHQAEQSQMSPEARTPTRAEYNTMKRLAKSPKGIHKFSRADPYVEDAVQELEKAVRLSEGTNTRAMYDLALMYRSLGERERALEILEQIIHIFKRRDSGPFDRVSTFEQAGLILREMSEEEPDKKKSEKLRRKAEAKLERALLLCSRLCSQLPRFQHFIPVVWQSFPVLMQDVNRQYHTSNEQVKEKAKLLQLIRENLKSNALLKELADVDPKQEDNPEYLQLKIRNLVDMQQYKEAVTVFMLLKVTREGLLDQEDEDERYSYNRVCLEAIREALQNAQSEEVLEYTSIVFSRVFSDFVLNHSTEEGESSDEDSDCSEDRAEDAVHVMLLHGDSAAPQALALQTVLEIVGGLSVRTCLQDDYMPGRPRLMSLEQTLSRCKMVVVLAGADTSNNEFKLLLDLAAEKPLTRTLLVGGEGVPSLISKRPKLECPGALLQQVAAAFAGRAVSVEGCCPRPEPPAQGTDDTTTPTAGSQGLAVETQGLAVQGSDITATPTDAGQVLAAQGIDTTVPTTDNTSVPTAGNEELAAQGTVNTTHTPTAGGEGLAGEPSAIHGLSEADIEFIFNLLWFLTNDSAKSSQH